MSIKSKGGNTANVTTDTLAKVRGVIAESQKHQYSVSRVYAAYNEYFGTSDRPQTCPSCLRARVRELKRALAEYESAEAQALALALAEAQALALAEAQAEAEAAKLAGPKAKTKGTPVKGPDDYA